jgi:L-iditol 2-dehydrogenase
MLTTEEWPRPDVGGGELLLRLRGCGLCGSDIAKIVRDGGSIHVFAGGGGESLPLPLAALYARELTLMATYSASPVELREAFDLIVSGGIATEGLVTHRMPLEQLGEAVRLVRRHEALKVYVTP